MFLWEWQKKKKCHSNVEMESYVANLYEKYFEIDNIISEYRDNHKGFEYHPCGKGYYNCCYDVFSISMLEFEVLLEELRNIGLEFAERIFKKSLEDLEVLRISNPDLYNRLEEDVTLQQDAALKDVNLYSKTERFPFSCPMLDESKGSCLVYNKRPMICRLFGTTHDSFSVMLDRRDESSVCEHIPSAQANVLQTPEVENSDFKINDMLETRYSGEVLLPREYPIVYWFKVYRDKNLKKGRPVYSSLVPSFYYKKPGSITLAELMP